MSCASPCRIGRAGFRVYESARRWRDNNSYNLQSCDHGLTHREPPFRVSVCVAVRGVRLPRRRAGLEPTPRPATERARCPYSEIFESGQRDIMQHFCFQRIDITSHIAQWHHGRSQLGWHTLSPHTTLVPCPMNPTTQLRPRLHRRVPRHRHQLAPPHASTNLRSRCHGFSASSSSSTFLPCCFGDGAPSSAARTTLLTILLAARQSVHARPRRFSSIVTSQ